jgi:hypothetical protein
MYERPYDLVSAPDGYAVRIRARGNNVLTNPMLNRGTAFTREERRQLLLTGLLPSGVSTMEAQLRRVYAQYRRQPDDLAQNVYLGNLRDRNEVLFYRLLSDHLEEMLPIVYTPTVGLAIERFSHEYRRPRGVYLSVDNPEDVEQTLENYGMSGDDVDLLVATDAEGILGHRRRRAGRRVRRHPCGRQPDARPAGRHPRCRYRRARHRRHDARRDDPGRADQRGGHRAVLRARPARAAQRRPVRADVRLPGSLRPPSGRNRRLDPRGRPRRRAGRSSCRCPTRHRRPRRFQRT